VFPSLPWKMEAARVELALAHRVWCLSVPPYPVAPRSLRGGVAAPTDPLVCSGAWSEVFAVGKSGTANKCVNRPIRISAPKGIKSILNLLL
jgi:hypothetical protein